MSEQSKVPRWEDCDAEARESVRAWLDSMRRAQAEVRDNARFTAYARQTAGADVRAIDAALARLAEPERSAEDHAPPTPCRCGHGWFEHVDATTDNACQRAGCSCRRWLAPAPTAAERWREVPGYARKALLDELDGRATRLERRDGPGAVAPLRALLALAREAEGGR